MSIPPSLPPTDPLEIARNQMGKLPVPVVLTDLLNATLAAPIEGMSDADLNAAERIVAVTLARTRMARHRLKGIQVQLWTPPDPPPFKHGAMRREVHPGHYDAHIVEAFTLNGDDITALVKDVKQGVEIVICANAISDPLGVAVVLLSPPADAGSGKETVKGK